MGIKHIIESSEDVKIKLYHFEKYMGRKIKGRIQANTSSASSTDVLGH